MLLTVKQVQQRLNVSHALIYRLVQQGELASHRIGSSIRISEEDLQAYLQRAKTHPHQPYPPSVSQVALKHLQIPN
ncbi:helix-turn-helix domain-containing protein [Bythopirellula goksoeyrii]|uniref:Helix-turn-helix domain protein n=1 Tax=Bythopirellula goksoeyrii TaxID=1400387 RepID=A0A5B9QAV4_9BACT|nr:helix-turn-helix domain-containing protein [Bythopirellula goksoeyrii]QEG36157.1 Helix-turn-helix domain protein [Bythopirellula goksoeyrii]